MDGTFTLNFKNTDHYEHNDPITQEKLFCATYKNVMFVNSIII